MLESEDPDHSGFKSLLELFYDKIFDQLEENFGEKSEKLLFELSKIINNYVLKRLTSALWSEDRISIPKDLRF